MSLLTGALNKEDRDPRKRGVSWRKKRNQWTGVPDKVKRTV